MSTSSLGISPRAVVTKERDACSAARAVQRPSLPATTSPQLGRSTRSTKRV